MSTTHTKGTKTPKVFVLIAPFVLIVSGAGPAGRPQRELNNVK